ncbi:MAG: hypothetical protein IJS09_06180 [Treponema sp.]|nr:hypothetical protein [Treponema sp.]
MLSSIIIGAIGSVLASVILYFLSQCYAFSSKKKVAYNLEMAFYYVYQIENHRSFIDDYELIMQNIERLHKCIFEIHFSIYPFSMAFRKTKKKFIQTLLFDITRRCEGVVFSTTGYSGEQEREERLYKLEKYFYNEESLTYNCSLVRLQLSIIKLLLNGMSIYKAFQERNIYAYNARNISSIIDINSFKPDEKIIEKTLIRNNGITHKQFMRLFSNKFLR